MEAEVQELWMEAGLGRPGARTVAETQEQVKPSYKRTEWVSRRLRADSRPGRDYGANRADVSVKKEGMKHPENRRVGESDYRKGGKDKIITMD